jgi:hypothetical protein
LALASGCWASKWGSTISLRTHRLANLGILEADDLHQFASVECLVAEQPVEECSRSRIERVVIPLAQADDVFAGTGQDDAQPSRFDEPTMFVAERPVRRQNIPGRVADLRGL